MNIIFIISQPRAGSTMMQAIISNHEDVSTVSEPWLLLYLLGRKPSFTKVLGYYTDTDSRKAYCDLLTKIQTNKKDQIIREFVTSCYLSLNGKTKYFIDKTPRYYLILSDIKRIFPNAKFLILKRNPIDVARSMKNVCMKNCNHFYNLAKFHHHDLVFAPKMIQKFLDENKLNKNVLSVKYEDVTKDPECAFRDIFEWLDMPFDKNILDYENNQKFHGLFGDPVTVGKQKTVIKNKRKDNKLEKYWTKFEKGYVHHLGLEFLEVYGYKSEEFGPDIKSSKVFDVFNSVGQNQCDKMRGWKLRLLDWAKCKFLIKVF